MILEKKTGKVESIEHIANKVSVMTLAPIDSPGYTYRVPIFHKVPYYFLGKLVSIQKEEFGPCGCKNYKETIQALGMISEKEMLMVSAKYLSSKYKQFWN